MVGRRAAHDDGVGGVGDEAVCIGCRGGCRLGLLGDDGNGCELGGGEGCCGGEEGEEEGSGGELHFAFSVWRVCCLIGWKRGKVDWRRTVCVKDLTEVGCGG